MDKIFIHQWCGTAAWGSDTLKKTRLRRALAKAKPLVALILQKVFNVVILSDK
ncbi:MAG: hypothetical protein P4L49_07470 [Desulfosporosinus sp.]|nr:hypothetical protein [Desulfosporosinus sp.]